VWCFAEECFVVDHPKKKGFRSHAAGLVAFCLGFVEYLASWRLAVSEMRGE
jgi:hypothetical protein